MSNVVRLKTQTQIDNEAAVWTWRLDCGDLSAGERGELEAWLREDPRNRRTFEELSLTWTALDRLAQRAGESVPAAEPPARRRSPLAALRPALRGRKAYWESAAAAMLVIALGTALWISRRPGMQVMSTAVGQHRRVTLADGTQLTLNTDTLLEVKLTARRRDIYLRRGEAHFGVVHDAARPFFVHVADAVVRDVGTQFEVRLHSDRDIDVLVDEGQVEVRGPAGATGLTGTDGARDGKDDWVRAVTAGEQLSIAGPNLKVMSVSPQQVADDLAWREGALVFEGEPLSQALAEVGRYTRTRIVLRGPEAAALHISGRFKTDDLAGFFRALQTALPVRVSRPAPDLVYVAAR
ncbi:MAG TPA: FecR domain-containing protein [Steroidobacteraceae bacterium]|nr:FecR domain-containing protein [Steroidobacteraceae bacterium]